MTKVNDRKVAIIGCGFVGSASAFALLESGLFSEIVLIDANQAEIYGACIFCICFGQAVGTGIGNRTVCPDR